MAIEPVQSEVVAQDAKLVGDEEVYSVDHSPEVDEVREDGVAVVASERERASDSVPVHEVHVRLDKVITDPSSPEAVQIPDAGRGSLALPAHRLGEDSPEAKFASGDADSEVSEDTAHVPADDENADA